MQALKLPLGIVEGIAQSQVDVQVTSAVGMQAVGVNMRARYCQVDFHAKVHTAVAAAIRSFEHHVTLHDPIAESSQTEAQLARALLEGARTVDVAKGQCDGQ